MYIYIYIYIYIKREIERDIDILDTYYLCMCIYNKIIFKTQLFHKRRYSFLERIN